MPRTPVVLFRGTDGSVPIRIWLQKLPDKARDACRARIVLLGLYGHDLRRPAADYVGDGVWELRAKADRVNYRMLYFFSGQTAVVSHGFKKQEARIPQRELDMARHRRRLYEENPRVHTHRE